MIEILNFNVFKYCYQLKISILSNCISLVQINLNLFLLFNLENNVAN